MVKIRDVKKLQQDIENDPIIKDQMADLGCVLVYTFGNFLAPVLVAAHTVNNLDLGDEQGLENEGYESDEKSFISAFFVSGDRIQNFFDQKEIKKMGLSVQRSVVGQLSFNGKKVQSVHVKGEECLVSRDGQKKSQTRFGKLMAKRSTKN